MSCYLGLSKRNDEYYTPAYAVKALLPYIKEKSTIWCPFDKQWSEFVRILTEHNHKVIFSHIDEGKDFFHYEPQESYDYIISNPPFSKKREILQRLNTLNKPYAMLLPINLLNDNYSNVLDSSLELIIFDRRMEFKGRNINGNHISFKTIYFCKNFLNLPHSIVFAPLNRNKEDEQIASLT